MAIEFTDEVADLLQASANDSLPIFNFIDIYLDGPQDLSTVNDSTFFPDIHICDWIEDAIDDVESSPSIYYYADLLKGVEKPPKTGNVSQEIQRVVISQALGLWDDPAEFVTRMGDRFHTAEIRVRSCLDMSGYSGVWAETNPINFQDPVYTGSGLVKSVSRSNNDQDVVVEFTNSYGKLDITRTLRTTRGSLQKRNKLDTSFDKAAINLITRTLNWGGQ